MGIVSAAMTGERSVVLIGRASKMLAEATTIQKARELKNLALTARDWAQRKGLGEAAIRHARTYALLAEDRLGELLAATERNAGGRPAKTCNQRAQVFPTLPELEISRRESSEAQAFHQLPEEIKAAVIDGEMTRSEARQRGRREQRRKKREAEERRRIEAGYGSATVELADAFAWLPRQEPCDLLITDPPFATDIENIEAFAKAWLPLALSKVKPTGRAFICIGPYPQEVHAYLAVRQPEQILIWVYRNTLGPLPKRAFFRNYQMILYYLGPEAPPFLGEEILDRLAAFEINAPILRHHRWEKPIELGERLIRLVPREAGKVALDPFAGSGTFLLAAAALGWTARGCDLDPEAVKIAKERTRSEAAA